MKRNSLRKINNRTNLLSRNYHSLLLFSILFLLVFPLVLDLSASAATAPQPPTGLTATTISSSRINLSWTAPSNNGGSAITGYMIERSANNGTTWSSIVNNTGSASTAYSNTGLNPSTSYSYRVSAINSIGTSSPSNTASATTKPAPPPVPTGITATPKSSSSITVSWTASTGATWYNVFSSTSQSGPFVNVAGTAATSFTNTGLSAGTTYYYEVRAWNTGGWSTLSSPPAAAITPNAGATYSIYLVRSGLLVSDSLTNETMNQQQLQANLGYWTYGGDAPAFNAPYAINRDTQGLHIGVQAPSNGTYAGYYAVTQNTAATLFHSVITTPVQTIPTNNVFYENGMYVQNATNDVNYVVCSSNTSVFGTVWAIFSATGDVNGATNFNLLWSDTSPNQQLTRDCTIITNGTNYLKVYLDGTPVYENKTLNLQMSRQLISFLEPQSSYAGQLLNGTFKDFYATTGENIQVTNLPNNAATVNIVDTSGNILATGQVSGGTATLNVGQYHLPLNATIKVYDAGNALIVSNSESIYGGDVYSFITVITR